MIQFTSIAAYLYAYRCQALAWHHIQHGSTYYQIDRRIGLSAQPDLGSEPNAFLTAMVKDALGSDCPVSPEGMVYLQSMPNPAWAWKALLLVLELRESETFARPISLFELQYAVWNYGMAGHEIYDLSLPLNELAPGQACQLMLEGYLLMAEDQDGKPTVIPNPIFIRPQEH